MPITATCNHCGKQYRVSSKFAGKSARCKACGTSFDIPALTAPPAPPRPNPYAQPASQSDPQPVDLAPDPYDTAPPSPSTVCPSCAKPMDPAAIVCVACGYNRKLKRSMNVQIDRTPARPARTPSEPRPARAPILAGHAGDVLGCLFFMALFLGIGFYEYNDLADLEANGGTRRVHSIIKIAYEIGGKNGVLTLCISAAALAPVVTALKVLKNRN